MTIISRTLRWGHVIINQLLPGLSQPRGGGIGTNIIVLQVIQPLLKRGCCHLVELVDPDQEILREDFRWQTLNQSIPFFHRHLQVITRVHSRERILPVIQVIIPFPDIKIKDTDRVHFLHFRIKFS